MLMHLDVNTFRTDCTDKEQAVKLLEEASEAYAAWQALGKPWADFMPRESLLDALADELADTITACANLAKRYGLDLQAAIDRVEARNRERGRYELKDR
jgi:NTP pyrophosphatase (non-canonical NTP hydrolase)